MGRLLFLMVTIAIKQTLKFSIMQGRIILLVKTGPYVLPADIWGLGAGAQASRL